MPPQPTPGDDDRRRGDNDENSQRNYGEPSESVDGEEHELKFSFLASSSSPNKKWFLDFPLFSHCFLLLTLCVGVG